jgi:hypothetical protein
MKKYPNESAKELRKIADYIEKGYLSKASIKIEKEDDGNYVILGEYVTNGLDFMLPNIINFYSCSDFTQETL